MSRSVSAARRAFADQLYRPNRQFVAAAKNEDSAFFGSWQNDKLFCQDAASVKFTLASALAYAAMDWPISPGRNKRPLTPHGRNDATCDAAQVTEWWKQHPEAEPILATGVGSGIVVLDVDVSDIAYGPDSLDALGVSHHPETPTSHSPRGGYHIFFRHPGPGHYVKTVASRLGPALDIRGDGGSITLPPGPGRFWDPVYGLDYPMAPMPEWMIIPEAVSIDAGPAPRSETTLSRYGEAALDSAVNRIVGAPAGQQEMTLNSEVFGIARLAGGGGVPLGIALDAMLWAARKMPSHDPHRPWRAADVEQKVRATFAAGIAKPRLVA
jgi:hypothetical protein